MTAHREARRRRGRRGILAVGVVLLGLALAWPAAVLGAAGDRLISDEQFSGVIDCGTFVDNFVDYYHVVETDEFDADGQLVRVTYHVEHHSTDVNSETGLTFHEHGHFREVDDFVAGTFTVTGSQEVATMPGSGVVVQDTGRLVGDQNGIVFFAGGRKHSNFVQGEQIYCDALD